MIANVLPPDETYKLISVRPSVGWSDLWVYRYTHEEHPWSLSIATHAPPGSGDLSLGGFRIVPVERAGIPGFDPDREAASLAVAMEDKVWWSRITGVAGERSRNHLERLTGGKCVLLPSPSSRVGESRDIEMLDFAIRALKELEKTVGFFPVTGQDLGHGILSSGESSLEWLSARHHGCVKANTSAPTAEGNFHLVAGMLRAAGVPLDSAVVGIAGCGNIGMRVLQNFRDAGAEILALESRADKRAELLDSGLRVWSPEEKPDFLAQPMDALVVNTVGGSLDSETVNICLKNSRLKVLGGSENLPMPNPEDARRLQMAGKLYAPTELGGMMGYLTAIEEYLARRAGDAFDIESVVKASASLETTGFEAARIALQSKNKLSFAEAVESLKAD